MPLLNILGIVLLFNIVYARTNHLLNKNNFKGTQVISNKSILQRDLVTEISCTCGIWTFSRYNNRIQKDKGWKYDFSMHSVIQ